MSSIFDKFDGFVIPSHLEGYELRRISFKRPETVQYWTVTITLTSGEVEEFYVKARNKQEALDKGESYAYLGKIGLKGGWSLLP